MSEPATLKHAIRRQVLAQRQAASQDAAVDLVRAWSGRPKLGTVRCVAGYWPLGSELDPRPLMQHLHDNGHELALPCMQSDPHGLVFRRYQPGDRLEQRRFGVHEPCESAPVRHPDLVFVPLVAVSSAGHRLGYGKGYYDATLSQARMKNDIATIGVAWEMQIREDIPVERHDVPLDFVVTSQGMWLDCQAVRQGDA